MCPESTYKRQSCAFENKLGRTMSHAKRRYGAEGETLTKQIREHIVSLIPM